MNVIGFDIGSEDLIKLTENGTDLPLQSICDDLSFSMYVEESITDTVRAIEILKKKAVNGLIFDQCDPESFVFELFFLQTKDSSTREN